MTPRTDLVAAAHTFFDGPLAMDERAITRLSSALRHLDNGPVNGDGLRAAAGLSAPTRAPRVSPKVVSVLSVTGVIEPTAGIMTALAMGTSMRQFMSELVIAKYAETSAIALVIDSPGGSARLVTEAAQLLREVRQHKPIIAIVTGTCASAAYWLAAQATRIEATQSADIGGVGVFCAHVDTSKALEKEGLTVTLLSAGRHKTEGNPTQPLDATARAHLQARVDEQYGWFVQDLAAGRRVPEATVRHGFGEGRVLSAPEALKAGMIDRVATLDDSLNRLHDTKQAVPSGNHLLSQPTPTLASERMAAVTDRILAPHYRALAQAARRS